MLGMAFIAILAGNLVDLRRGQLAIETERTRQVKVLADAKRAENQLFELARGTQLLAEKGNPNAAAVAAVLHQNGIEFKATPPAQ